MNDDPENCKRPPGSFDHGRMEGAESTDVDLPGPEVAESFQLALSTAR